jgi:hypothetical protein
MSDYKRGKLRAQAWANHWDEVAEHAGRSTTIEAKLIEYGCSVRNAFQKPSEPNILIMSPWIKSAHMDIMALEPKYREILIIWHFGDEDERRDRFGNIKREPRSLVPIYKRLGRSARGATNQSWAKKNLR